MQDPLISIDRQTQRYACFDAFQILKPFEKYKDEQEAIKSGIEFFKSLTTLKPRIVYPKITKARVR